MARNVPLSVSRPELLVDGSDDMFREMVHRALAYSVRLQSVRDGYAKYIGLTGIQYTIVISIAHLEDKQAVGVNVLSKHLSLSATFVTTEVGKLVKQKLISKCIDKNDKRRVVLSLTAKAWKLLESLSDIQQDINNIGYEPLSRTEFRTVHRLFGELTQSTDRSLVMLDQVFSLREFG